jgi:formamidopyrimidine-DNA glycosylase
MCCVNSIYQHIQAFATSLTEFFIPMPELPEVETTRRAIAQVVTTRPIKNVILRRGSLRWPIPEYLPQILTDASVLRCERRGKYLLLFCESSIASGWLLIHLGMSGTVCTVTPDTPIKKHDHVDFDCGDVILRYNDPRRFGAILWLEGHQHALPSSPLLDSLGVEPLSNACSGVQLYAASRGLTTAVKLWLLAGKAVVGVGNIYCSESLFYAKIHPAQTTGSLSKMQCLALFEAIVHVLQTALNAGGTTLNDFASGAHTLGQYQNSALAYGRAGLPCVHCRTPIALWLRNNKAVGGRATYFCPNCQLLPRADRP